MKMETESFRRFAHLSHCANGAHPLTMTSIIVRADIVTTPPEWAAAGLGASVVIGADVVVVVPIGVLAMETMVVVVAAAQAVEGPTGGDGRPRAGEAASAMGSAAGRSTTR